MGKRDIESPLTRRLRELEEEERALQQHLKEVSRKARKMETLTSEPGFNRGEPRVASTVPRPGAEPVEEDAAPPAPERPAAKPVNAPGMAPRNPGVSPDRFANYFANGSFGNSRPMGRESKLVRNKAIFMLIILALLAFVLYRVVFSA